MFCVVADYAYLRCRVMPREFDQHVRSLRSYVTKFYAKKQKQKEAEEAGESARQVEPAVIAENAVAIEIVTMPVDALPEACAEEEVGA